MWHRFPDKIQRTSVDFISRINGARTVDRIKRKIEGSDKPTRPLTAQFAKELANHKRLAKLSGAKVTEGGWTTMIV